LSAENLVSFCFDSTIKVRPSVIIEVISNTNVSPNFKTIYAMKTKQKPSRIISGKRATAIKNHPQAHTTARSEDSDRSPKLYKRISVAP
jgi:hypothetical protein